MAHPKRKTSKARRGKRSNHRHLAKPLLVVCPVTGVTHPPHQAYENKGKLYYKGRVVMELT